MNIKTYSVKIDKDEVLRYLGFVRPKGAAQTDESAVPGTDAMVSAQIDSGIKAITDAAQPKYIYRVFDLKRGGGQIMLANTSTVIAGHDAAVLLKDCTSCIVMAVTLGQKSEMLLRRAQITDMTEAVILDSCASSAIESVCEQLDCELRTEYKARGLYLTDRFSPGYGDMPLSLQPELCTLLQTEKRIGLSVSPGLTLIPSKSVTAIIGISDKKQKMREVSCDACRLRETCKMREAGATCGNRKD